MAHPGGRPTVYAKEMNVKAKEYLESCVDLVERDIVQVKLPSVVGLARYLGVARSTVFLWAKEHEEFSDSLAEVVEAQEEKLLNQGLAGNYNSTIAKLVMSSNHGYKEKSDVTTNDKDLPVPIMAGVIKSDANNKA